MNRRTDRRLKAERARRVDEAARALLDGDDLGAAKENLDWIDACAQLRRAAQRAGRARWTIIAGFLCLLLVGTAATVRTPSAHVALEIETEDVQFLRVEEWVCNYPYVLDRIVLDGVTAIDGYGLGLEERYDPAEEIALVALQGGGIELEELEVMADAKVELSAREGELLLFVTGAPVSGRLLVWDAALTIEAKERKREIQIAPSVDDPPETIAFTSDRGGSVPARIALSTETQWRLAGFRAEEIGFVEECPPASNVFVSKILAGEVTVLETGTTEDMLEGEFLILKGVDSRRLWLSKSQDGVRVSFEGSVAQVLAGPQRFKKNLKPTLLAFVYHQKPLAILWSAVAFLFGIVWRIRRVFLA